MYKTIILPVVSCVCEMWYLIQRDEQVALISEQRTKEDVLI